MELPIFLIDMLNKQYGQNLTNKIIEGYKLRRKTTIRVNTIKESSEKITRELENNNIEYEKVSWYDDALIINNAVEKDIEKLNIFKEGKIYMQSLSSMLPPLILNPQKKIDILDMAAAPGGKTTQIAALTENEAHITACEINPIRIEKLKYNIEKQGAEKSVYIMKEDSRKINDFFSFDQILLDAPCSGSGTINIEDKNLEKFTIKLIEKSTKSQLELLRKAIKILKPGKEMVYSTCSILDVENEKIIEKVLKEDNVEIVPIDVEKYKDIEFLPNKIEGTICVCPNEKYEGFFVAKLKKK